MVKAFRLALWVLSTASVSTATLEARTDATERSILGKKVHKSDVIRVQDARLKRLEERVQKMSADEAVLAERTRQHREMRLKGNKDLKDRVEELKLKLQNERERMQKEFESQLMTVREEMWAQAARDRDALEAELSSRHEAERSRFLEEAGERDNEIVEEAKRKMAEEMERDRELYAQRAALAEEGQEIAREERNQLQAEKESLLRQLKETMEMDDASRRRIILKFKAREHAMRKNFEAELREARGEASTSGEVSEATAEEEACLPSPNALTAKRPRSTIKSKSKMASSSASPSMTAAPTMAAVKSSGGGLA
ncbi:unnamed protein product [Ectocarpus sp. 12 AP-2014]